MTASDAGFRRAGLRVSGRACRVCAIALAGVALAALVGASVDVAGAASVSAKKGKRCRGHRAQRSTRQHPHHSRRCRGRRRRRPSPRQATAALPDTAIDSGPGGPTNDATPTFSFHSSGEASGFQCSIDSGAAGFVPCSGPGAAETAQPLADGSYTFRVRAVGPGGPDPSPATRSFSVDTLPPSVSMSIPGEEGATSDNTPTLSGGTGTAAGDSAALTVRLYAGGSASGTPQQTVSASVAGAVWSASPSPLADGTYTAQAEQGDGAGNVGHSPPVTFTINSAPPDTQILSAPEGRIPPGRVAIKFTADEPEVSFECGLDGAAYKACASPYQLLSPKIGPHSLLIRAVNASGAMETAPALVKWSTIAPVERLCGTVDEDETIGPAYATVYLVDCFLLVEARLTVEPGTIIKSEFGAIAAGSNGVVLLEGTAPKPVVFTSAKDDSVGGDTNEDGSATAPSYWDSFRIEAWPEGALKVEHADVRYGAIEGTDPSIFIVRDSSVRFGFGAGIRLRAPYSPVVPEITRTTVSDTIGAAVVLEAGHLDPTRLSGNDGTDNYGGLELAGAFTASGSLSEGSLVPEIGIRGEQPNMLTIAHGVTLTLPPGQVVKSGNNTTISTVDRYPLVVLGDLRAEGTSAAPVTFSSHWDDSIGGDTSGEGGATAPAAGDWQGIQIGRGGRAKLEHTNLRYALVALNAERGAAVGVRGTFFHNSRNVEACDWGRECAVDAAFSDWGASAGPASPATVCGAVTTSPYLFEGSQLQPEALPVDCEGPESPWQELIANQEAFDLGVVAAEESCAAAEDEACEPVSTGLECASDAFDAVIPDLPFSLTNPFDEGGEWQEAGTAVGSAAADWLAVSAPMQLGVISDVALRREEIDGLAVSLEELAAGLAACEPSP